VALDVGAGLEVSALARSVGISRGKQRARKFGNVPTVVGGEAFDSKREANRYAALRLMGLAGRIRKLRRQVKYALEVNGVRICTWKADFVYEELRLPEQQWVEVVEDVKGYPNDRWPMKKKLMLACHGVKVRET
jgi:hypothetical protein